MQKLTLSQFEGGLQESTGPRDFGAGEWSQIKGFVFEKQTRLETQWPIQTIGLVSGFRAVFPIVATSGTYLVGITTAGALYWCVAPSPTATKTVTQATTWNALTTTQNIGYDDAIGSAQPGAEAIVSNADYRFVCAVSVPIADYWVTPDGTNPEQRNLDVGARQGMLPGVLVNTLTRQTYSQAVVCFVDTDNTVKAIKFPAWRRLYQYDLFADTVTDTPSGAGTNSSGEKWITPIAKAGDYFWLRVTNLAVSANTCTLTLKRITNSRTIVVNGDTRSAGSPILEVGDWIMVSGVAAGVDGTRQITNVNSTTKTIQFYVPSDDVTSAANGGIIRLITRPFPTDDSGDLHSQTDFRMMPYYYIDNDGATLPGRGVMPRANVGVMWKELLLLGDVEWRLSAGTSTYYPSDATFNFPLRNGTTGPYPNYMYVSAGELDTFYPYGILETAPNGARILGMHIIKDTLVIITTAAGADSGVIGIRGNLGEVLTSTFNPAQTTFRKDLIKGGVGGVDAAGNAHRQFSCLWPEAGVAAFVDAAGGVWYTNGLTCQRLDITGPKAPVRAVAADHVAAAGRHLFVWRAGRLLTFSILGSGTNLTGAWTELVPPSTQMSSMVGTSSELYFVNNDGLVQRYALAGPVTERGMADYYRTGVNTYQTDVLLPLELSTPTIDFGDEHTRKNWHRFGISFQTETYAYVDAVTIRASGALNAKGGTPSYSPISAGNFKLYTSTADELHELVVPAGIGMQNVASATVGLSGHVILESAAFWATGANNKRGDD